MKEDRRRVLREPLTFRCTINRDTDYYEIRGEDRYQDIIAYGETFKQASPTLEQDIPPFICKNYASGDNARLTPPHDFWWVCITVSSTQTYSKGQLPAEGGIERQATGTRFPSGLSSPFGLTYL